jgi:phytoene synthase
MMKQDDQNYCIRQARARDYDRYIATLAAPSGLRGYLSVLLAFNDEIARVRDTVSEPALGDIRLTWWREAVNEAALGTPKDNPIARALAATLQTRDVDPHYLHTMIDARGRDLDDAPFSSLAELEAYADATSGNLSLALLEALGVKEDAAQTAARQSGTAWALIGLLRAMPHHRRAGREFIAGDINASTIARRAEDLIIAARGLSRQIPRQANAALLSNRIADIYLTRLTAAGGDVEKADFEISQLKKAATVLWHKVLGRY